MNSKKYSQPEGTDKVVHIKNIIIPEDFLETRTGWTKIRRAMEYYQRNKHFDKPITVRVEQHGLHTYYLLQDEYARYQAAQIMKFKHVPIKYIEVNESNMR